jgi:hypothetical protein
MSSTPARRLKKRMEKDIKKGILKSNKDVRNLQLPTIEEIQQYINNKVKEMEIDPFDNTDEFFTNQS